MNTQPGSTLSAREDADKQRKSSGRTKTKTDVIFITSIVTILCSILVLVLAVFYIVGYSPETSASDRLWAVQNSESAKAQCTVIDTVKYDDGTAADSVYDCPETDPVFLQLAHEVRQEASLRLVWLAAFLSLGGAIGLAIDRIFVGIVRILTPAAAKETSRKRRPPTTQQRQASGTGHRNSTGRSARNGQSGQPSPIHAQDLRQSSL